LIQKNIEIARFTYLASYEAKYGRYLNTHSRKIPIFASGIEIPQSMNIRYSLNEEKSLLSRISPLIPLEDIVVSMGKLTNKLVYIADMQTGELLYLVNSKRITPYILTDGAFLPDFKSLNETLLGADAYKIEIIYQAIKQFYATKQILPYSGSITFLTELPFLPGLRKDMASYQFVPLRASEGEIHVGLVLGTVGFSSGQDRDALYCIYPHNHRSYVYDLSQKDGMWKPAVPVVLSEVEISVLSLAAQGLDVKQSSEALSKPIETIKTVRKRIFDKLEVPNITSAVMYAMSHRVL
jgi:DNA-binding CsgD family transcriptional regulator